MDCLENVLITLFLHFLKSSALIFLIDLFYFKSHTYFGEVEKILRVTREKR